MRVRRLQSLDDNTQWLDDACQIPQPQKVAEPPS